MDNYYSLSDIKSALGGEEGMGGGWFLIVILFLFLFGFGNNRNGMGMGNCGNDGYVTTSQFESENNFRTLDNSNRMTQNGLCQLGYEMAGSYDTEWTLPEMHAALILLRALLPCHELRRIISEVECEGWAVLDTPDGDISFQEDDIPMLRKILGKRKEERYGAED